MTPAFSAAAAVAIALIFCDQVSLSKRMTASTSSWSTSRSSAAFAETRFPSSRHGSMARANIGST